MSTQKPETMFPDHLSADAWNHDLHAYQTRDMEPAPEPEHLSTQCDRCGNVTRPLGWRNGETLCTSPGSCLDPDNYKEDDGKDYD